MPDPQVDTEESVSFEDLDFTQDLETVEPEAVEDAPIKDIEAKTDTEQVVDEAPPEYTPLDAPEFFSKEHKELFTKLQAIEHEEAKEIARQAAAGWHDQYNEGQKFLTQKSQAISDEKRQFENQLNEYNQYQQALQPINEIWQRQGIAPAVGVAQMAYYGQLLHTDPQALITEVAKFANIDLNQVVEDQPYIDPAMQERFRTLEQQNTQLQQAIGQFQQGQQSNQQNAAQAEASQFIDKTDANGNYLYPHVREDSPHAPQVGQDMLYWMQSPTSDIAKIQNPQEKLLKAYEKAIQNVPEVQAEQQAQREKEAAEKRQAEAEKAKQAAVRTSSKTQDASKPKSVDINDLDFGLDDD